MRTILLGCTALLLTAAGLAGTTASAAAEPGSLDPTFVTGSGFTDPSGAYVTDIALQPDGKIVVGGSFTAYNGTPRNNLVRLNPDGSLDTTLQQVAGGFNGGVADVDVLPDGDLLVAGRFTQYGPTAIRAIARLNSDGTIDTSFAPGTSIVDGAQPTETTVYDALALPNGKVVAVGEFTKYGVQPRPRILRLQADGDLDYTFFPGAGFTGGTPEQVTLKADGTLLVAGLFTQFDGAPANFITVVNADGAASPGFASPLSGSGVYVSGLLADASVLIGGLFELGSGWQSLARLQSTGAGASGFTSGLDWDYVFGFAQQSDGKFVVGGRKAPGGRLARITSDGAVDPTFSIGTQPDANVTEIAIQSDNKILVGGPFTSIAGQPAGGIARVLSGLEPTPATPTDDPTSSPGGPTSSPGGPTPNSNPTSSPTPSTTTTPGPQTSPGGPAASVPGKVRSVRAIRQKKRTVVRWKAPTNSTVTGYQTRISRRNAVKFRPWARTTASSRAFASLAKGRYRFQIVALNSAGRGPTVTTSFKAPAPKRR